MKRPAQLVPAPSRVIRGVQEGSERGQPRVSGFQGTAADLPSSVVGLSAGPPVSSQQINLDWSRFENHTFFDSASGKVNASFLKIINEFPFDGGIGEVRSFVDSLSGFEKYIYDIFPRSTGSLIADGTCFIETIDQAGSVFPNQSRDPDGREVIAPNGKDFSFQAHIKPNSSHNRVQVISQYRQDVKNGFTLFLSHSESTDTTRVVFAVSSGSVSMSTSAPVQKGAFQHIVAQYGTTSATSSLEIFVDAALAATSSGIITLGEDFRAPSITFFSGSSFFEESVLQTPDQLYTGGIDDIRLYHARRSLAEIREDSTLPGYASDSLVLYYRLNEPAGDHAQASVVLDGSGNSLHARISQYTNSVRSTASAVQFERAIDNPVLFPDFADTLEVNSDLVASGSAYDQENPNFILRLVPQHYFNEAQIQHGLASVQGDLANPYRGTSIPGSGELGSIQILTSMLLMYAKSFDEIKIFHDHFSRLTYVDYDENSSVSDQFLGFLARYYGFDLPNLFPASSVEQYVRGSGVSVTETLPLKRVQDIIFRRILTNMREILTAKGTHASIRALLNASGIAPGSFFRIREYGGPTEVKIEGVREDVTEVTSVLTFSGSNAPTLGSLTYDGFDERKPRIISGFLTGSRTEPGFPPIGGQLVNGVSDSPNDGLLTSGSWTLEGQYSMSSNDSEPQSLMRLHTTGDSAYASRGGEILNVIAQTGSISAYYACDNAGGQPLFLQLADVNLFDGGRWHVSFSRRRADDRRSESATLRERETTYTRSQYTLTCQRAGQGAVYFATSSFFDDAAIASNSAIESKSSQFNASGAFIVIGSQSIAADPSYPFLNNTSVSSLARQTNFSGKVSQVRFWSHCLDEKDLQEHARSYRSMGVRDPIVNFGFNETTSGSFARLRVDLSCDQIVTGTDAAGEIEIFDHSQQMRHASGRGFEPLAAVILPETVLFSQVSTRFDMRQTDSKVRVRSYSESSAIIGDPDSLPAPVYEQVRSEPVSSDPRIAIEASAVDALNDDIVKLIASLDFFDRALGDPRVMFDDHYPDLEALRRVYFNRLTDKPDLRAMYDVFNWVSRALGDLIGQLIPMNSVYLGVSYVVESHVAERSRVRYYFDRQYYAPTEVERISLTTGTNTIDLQSTSKVAGEIVPRLRSKR